MGTPRTVDADIVDQTVASVTAPVIRAVARLGVVGTLVVVAVTVAVDSPSAYATWVTRIAVVTIVFAILTLVFERRGFAARPDRRWAFDLWPWALVVAGAAATSSPDSTLLGALCITSAYVVAAVMTRLHAMVAMVVVGSVLQVAAVVLRRPEDVPFVVALIAVGLLIATIGVAARRGYRSSVAEQLAARAEAESHARNLEVVASTARAVDVLEPEALLRSVADTVEQLGWQQSMLYVPSRDGDDLVLVASSPGTETEPRDGGVLEQVMRSGATVAQDDGALPAPGTTGGAVTVVVGTPVTAGGETVGALVVGRHEPPLTSSDVRLVELVAAQAGRALETARAFAVQRRVVEQAEALARAKDDFVATVSHELRTPLTAVLGMTETLRDRWEAAAPAVRRSFLERIHSNAAGLADIVEVLLDLARAETSRRDVLAGTVDVVALVEVVVERLRPLHDAHRLQVEAPHAGTTFVAGDAVLLDRVVENLVVNACTHTPAGTLVRLVATRDGDDVRIAVVDDGPGIVEDDLERVTERFFRGGDHLRRSTRGLGLGLAVCTEVLRLHDATLEVHSRPGEGATFAFELPRVPVGVAGAADRRADGRRRAVGDGAAPGDDAAPGGDTTSGGGTTARGAATAS